MPVLSTLAHRRARQQAELAVALYHESCRELALGGPRGRRARLLSDAARAAEANNSSEAEHLHYHRIVRQIAREVAKTIDHRTLNDLSKKYYNRVYHRMVREFTRNDSKMNKGIEATMEGSVSMALVKVPVPRIVITFCTGCKWNLRAAYYAQELLSTFGQALGEVTLNPGPSGSFAVNIWYEDKNSASGKDVVHKTLWDRKDDKGFPETKELKKRVRDCIAPGRDLGHVDRHNESTPRVSTEDANTQSTPTVSMVDAESQDTGVAYEESKEGSLAHRDCDCE